MYRKQGKELSFKLGSGTFLAVHAPPPPPPEPVPISESHRVKDCNHGARLREEAGEGAASPCDWGSAGPAGEPWAAQGLWWGPGLRDRCPAATVLPIPFWVGALGGPC